MSMTSWAHPDTATGARTVPVRSACEQGAGLGNLKASLLGEAAADGDRPRSARHDSAPVSRCARTRSPLAHLLYRER
jgi:hypothetical protein